MLGDASMNGPSRFLGSLLTSTLVMQCCDLAYAKPQLMPPDIIGDDGRNNGPKGSTLEVAPGYLKWMQSHPHKNFDAPIDPAAEAFFPKESQLSNSLKRWYYHHLAAMGEKSFRSLSKKDTVYRFLWLRSFHHPISVSIEILNHGNDGAILHAVELDGGDIYGAPPGKQLRNFSYRYFPKLTKELIAKVDTTKFWTLPPNDDAPNLMRFDGAQWVMEGWKEGKYRLVRRFSPGDGNFRELCVIFLLLARLYPTKSAEIY
jgi:hypothetical protein